MQDQHQKYESTLQFQYQKKAKEIKDQAVEGARGGTPDLHHFLKQKYFSPRKIGKHKVFTYFM